MNSKIVKLSKKVMIVEADREYLYKIWESLLLNGYDPIDVKQGSRVINLARIFMPFVILMELTMPHINGFQIADDLKKSPITSTIPIIPMTGYYTGEDHILLMKSCGMEKLLKKPFYLKEMIRRVDNLKIMPPAVFPV